MNKYFAFPALMWLICAAVLSCSKNKESTPAAPSISVQRLTDNGGRVDWYQGTAQSHELLVFDATTDAVNKYTDVFTIKPDGSERTCVTCALISADLNGSPKRLMGQPKWHPDGTHIIFTVENSNSTTGYARALFSHMAWGFNNDFYTIRKDGTGIERFYQATNNWAILHPKISKEGTRIAFARREPTGLNDGIAGVTPLAENHWKGWHIVTANFDVTQSGSAKISAAANLFYAAPPAANFYETSTISSDGTVFFSRTLGGASYCNELFAVNWDGTGQTQLTNQNSSWDEFGIPSPSGRTIAFMSSRAYPDLDFSTGATASQLKTELYVIKKGASPLSDVMNITDIQQVTRLNTEGDPAYNYIVSRLTWDRSGRRIAFIVAITDKSTGNAVRNEIWMATFPEEQ